MADRTPRASPLHEHSMDERLAALLEYDQGSLRGVPEFRTIIHVLNELLQRVKKLEEREIRDRRP